LGQKIDEAVPGLVEGRVRRKLKNPDLERFLLSTGRVKTKQHCHEKHQQQNCPSSHGFPSLLKFPEKLI
jgi:hypothetical protein